MENQVEKMSEPVVPMLAVEMKDKVIKVPVALDNVSGSLAGFVADVRKALADGWQPGADITAIVASSVSRFATALGQWDQVAPAMKEHMPESIKCVAVNAVDAVFLPTV